MNKRQYGLMLVVALVAGLVGGVVSSQFLVGQAAFARKKEPPRKVIEAQEFRLVDKDGKTRAFLGFGSATEGNHFERGQPKLVFYDRTGESLVNLGISVNAQLVDLEKPEKRIYEEWPRLKFFSQPIKDEPKEPVGLYLRPGLIEMTDVTRGKTIIDIRGLHFYGANDKPRLIILSEEPPGIAQYDGNGATRILLGAAEIRSAYSGKILKRFPPSLVFFDKEGKVIWQAP